MKKKTGFIIALGAAALISGFAGQARADEWHGHGHEYEHEHWDRGWHHRPVPQVVYTPVYYQPVYPPYVIEQPRVVYVPRPAPVYYVPQPEGVSFNFVIK